MRFARGYGKFAAKKLRRLLSSTPVLEIALRHILLLYYISYLLLKKRCKNGALLAGKSLYFVQVNLPYIVIAFTNQWYNARHFIELGSS